MARTRAMRMCVTDMRSGWQSSTQRAYANGHVNVYENVTHEPLSEHPGRRGQAWWLQPFEDSCFTRKRLQHDSVKPCPYGTTGIMDMLTATHGRSQAATEHPKSS